MSAAFRVSILTRHCVSVQTSADAAACGSPGQHLRACATADHGQVFDYIIVGAGSAGCVLAARLSEDPATSVLLLEAGGAGESFKIRSPFGYSMIQRKMDVDWAFESEPQPHQAGRVQFWPRGRCLGGSSAINAMLYVRGDPETYNSWASCRGCEGWSFSEVLPFFQKSEGCLDRAEGSDMGDHGQDGPLLTRQYKSLVAGAGDKWIAASRCIARAMVEAGVTVEEDSDYNSGFLNGRGGFAQHTSTPESTRCSAAEGYLRRSGAMARPNLRIQTCSRVIRIVLQGQDAQGVLYLQGATDSELRRSHVHFAAARREVIVAAGAVQSPQLLMLSGIGPPAHLADRGVSVAVPLPGVGRHLVDHLFLPHMFAAKESDSIVRDSGKLSQMLPAMWHYATKGVGPAAAPGVSYMAFLNTGLEGHDDVESKEVDLQFHVCPGIPNIPRLNFFSNMNLTTEQGKIFEGDGAKLPRGIMFLPTLLRPKSEGFIELASVDPLVPPRIQPNYLEDPYDVQVLVKGMRLARQICRAPALANVCGEEVVEPSIPHPVESDAYLEEYVRRTASTVYHPMGSCRMGPASDPDAVVDAGCRVHGVGRLRIVDASVMPTAMTGNTNAPTVMIAEKVVAMIRGLNPSSPE